MPKSTKQPPWHHVAQLSKSMSSRFVAHRTLSTPVLMAVRLASRDIEIVIQEVERNFVAYRIRDKRRSVEPGV
jgi:hypothetical protein